MQIEQINNKILELSNDWAKHKNELASKNMIQKLENKIHNLETIIARQDFLTNSYVGSNYSTKGLNEFIRFGELAATQLNTKSTQLTASGEEGGYYLTQPTLHQKIIGGIKHKSPMRQLANIESISGSVLDIVIEDNEFATGWVAEQDDRVSTNSSVLLRRKIAVHELYAQPKATQKLLDDSNINIENWLIERLEESFANAENRSFIFGNGISQPRGILYKPEEYAIEIIKCNKIDLEALLLLINSLDDYYHANSTLLMHRTTLSKIQTIQDSLGRFIWQPKLSTSLPQTILGIPVICASDMPIAQLTDDATFCYPIVLADFKLAYKIVDHATNIKMTRDPYTEKPFIKFYAVKRVGGDIIVSKAIRILQLNKDK
ncbi:phage major capsid protein, HK97 family [Orientia chuto str. Dubai]|uniref:Phage major capsid protein, HK97 family n=1 Tax=Orientia chuto str. Dubai TaxID=1359168 RepID=A0A0F3MPU1_9RICK|nr:phage major capsid protein [Candidatus Orientia mediorientalis]KJV57482.1 phage major capsid protein, HK97 family [Orientia chuto str. Dubai]